MGVTISHPKYNDMNDADCCRFFRAAVVKKKTRKKTKIGQCPDLKIVSKKKWTVSGFLHTGPKKGVEKEYTIIFYDFFDTKIRHTF